MGLLLFQKLFPAPGTSADGRGRGGGLLLLGLLGLGVRDQLLVSREKEKLKPIVSERQKDLKSIQIYSSLKSRDR